MIITPDYNSLSKNELIEIINSMEHKIYAIEVKKLRERIKELNCIYSISDLIENSDISLEEILKKAVLLIPPGWQYPEITVACIHYEGISYATPSFMQTEWIQVHDLTIFGEIKGKLEVCYLEKVPEEDIGPFLNEEANLIKALADRIQKMIERIETREQLKKSAHEKEVLLKELHHRVKNNLQVISGLITLQISRMKGKIALDVFQDLQNRIKTIALTHDLLHRSEQIEKIEIPTYFELIVSNVFQTFQIDKNYFHYRCFVENFSLDVDTITNCGLIVNELVTNSLKHAFIGRSSGEVTVRLEKAGKSYCLSVGDNGVGFMVNLNIENTDSLGLSLIKMFVKKLRGRISMDTSNGTTIKITWD